MTLTDFKLNSTPRPNKLRRPPVPSATPRSYGELHLSELTDTRLFTSLKSFEQVITEHQAKEIEFEEDVESMNREVEAERFALQTLMTRAHAYCKNSGVASGTPFLPSVPPRLTNRPVALRPRASSITTADSSYFSARPPTKEVTTAA